MISNRLKYFDSQIFREAIDRQALISNPIDLSVGKPEELTPSHIKQAGIKAIQNNHTEYTPASGTEELRLEITKKLKTVNGINCSLENVTVVPGLTTGLLLVYLALLDPGDEIIVLDPYYPPYSHLASMIGAHVVHVPVTPNFQPNISLIEASIGPRTKAIIVNSPNNPTGAVYEKSTLEKIAEVAAKKDLLIISDEIYENFIFEGSHHSIGSFYPNTLTMNGFSKAYAMTGWRVGYICGPEEIIDAINELQQYAVFSSSSIAQHAAVYALRHPMTSVYKKYEKKRSHIISRLSKIGYKINGAQGAYYIYLKVPTKFTDIEFAKIAADNNLIVIPGSAFSDTINTYVRISYGADIKTVEKGIDVIEKISKLR